MVKSVRSRKRERSETSEASVNWSSKSSKLERNWFRSSSGRLVLMSLSNATNSGRETVFPFSRNVWLHWCLMTSSERVRRCSRWRYLPIWKTSRSERCSVS